MSLFHEPVSVPALNLKAQYHSIRDEIEPVVREVLESQMFVLGPEVARLEAEVAEYCGASSGIGCASGSDALLLPLLAIDVGPGDEVITTPYTFFATAGSIWRTGARPVFVDIEPDTFNIDPAQIEVAITPRTKAIIPVHLYGQVADMGPIKEIGRKHGLTVLEDAAQAIGSAYHGTRAGTLGDVTAFSFYPSKNLGGFGDGGMVTTNDPELARRMARLRVHGMEPKYHHHDVGFNSRLDAFQAAVLRVKLRHLDDWTSLRREVADRYRNLFASHGLEEIVGAADRAARQFPRVQPVCHSGAGDVARLAARPPHHAEDRFRDLLPDPAALAGLLRLAGVQTRRLSSRRVGRPRNPCPAHLPGTDRLRAALCRGLDSPVHRRIRISFAENRPGRVK